ncbi:MAG: M24 family metallopeptidase, partial [Candidatus Hadarchaeales archaeon]
MDAYISFHSQRYFSLTTAGKAVIIPLDGPPILICSRLEFWQAKEESAISDIRAFSSWKSPKAPGENVCFMDLWKLIGISLKEIGALSVGYEDASRSFIKKIKTIHPASYREAPEIVMNLRKIKSREEIACLEKSAKIAVRGMRCAAESIAVGRTELEIAGEVEREMRRASSEGTPFPTIVASGRNSWHPHATAGQKKINQGELVVVDLGATWMGYASDMTRTFAISPTKKQLKLLETVKTAHDAASQKLMAGIAAKEIDATARKILQRAGLLRFLPHGCGHGVGLDIHELPSLAPNSKDILMSGMVTTVEPGAYMKNIGGARWENMFLILPEGRRCLTEI